MPQSPVRRGSSHEIIRAIQQVVAEIPAGSVMSYGAVAKRAGFPRHARMVARALRLSETELPWFRVVNHQGAVSPRGLNGEDDLQRMLLEAEGLEFDAQGRLDLSRHAWQGKR
jgi:methylated-DNA-protein-cysteine methyltransferase-like protein